MRSIPSVVIWLTVACLAFAGGQHSSLASSTPFTVNSESDAPDSSPGDGFCQTQGGECSLRAAVEEGNFTTGSVTIMLPAGDYVLSQGELTISRALTINGDGAATTTVDAGGQSRVFFVTATATAAMHDLTVTGGDSDENGGGILNIGNLTVTDSIILGNTADLGGGLASGSQNGRLAMDRTRITGNSADRGGGGLFLADPGTQATITNTEISHNTALVYTGGVHTQGGVNASFTNVTISDNTSPPPTLSATSGNDSTTAVTLTNVTIAGNNDLEGNSTAIGIYSSAQLALKNSIVQADIQACFGDGTFASLGHNIDSDGSCHLTGPGDMPGVDPLLGPLANNGGPTQTRALLSGSPAIDTGDNNGCPSTDQRGAARPQGIACDVGAFEVEGPLVLRHGDVNCDGVINLGDAIGIARHLVSLLVNHREGCPELGSIIHLDGETIVWADADCSDAVSLGDAIAIARSLVSLPVNKVDPQCPNIGDTVQVS